MHIVVALVCIGRKDQGVVVTPQGVNAAALPHRDVPA
jgi:hypothetical protein